MYIYIYIIILFKKYCLIIFKTRPWKIICWQVCYNSCHTISLQWRMQPGWHQDLCQRLGSPAVRQGCCWRIEWKLMELMSFEVCGLLFELFFVYGVMLLQELHLQLCEMHYVHNFGHATLVLWFLCAYYYAVHLWDLVGIFSFGTSANPEAGHCSWHCLHRDTRAWHLPRLKIAQAWRAPFGVSEWVLVECFHSVSMFFFGNREFLQEILTLTLHHEIQRRSSSVHCLHCLRRRSLVIYQKIEISRKFSTQLVTSSTWFCWWTKLCTTYAKRIKTVCITRILSRDTFSPVFEDISVGFPFPSFSPSLGSRSPWRFFRRWGDKRWCLPNVKSHGTRMIKHCMVSTLFPYMYTYIEIGSHAHIERCARIRSWILFTVI